MPPGHHESHGSYYSNDSWIGLGSYTPSGQQLGGQGQNGYRFASASVPIDPNYWMPRPPPYGTTQPKLMPPPIVMPQQEHIWPSILATSSDYQQPIPPAVTGQTPFSATSMGPDVRTKVGGSRRKLTDDERRLMCLEAENNPTMKQTQIGAKFNVERSTVSKILRQKDKYMQLQPQEEDGTRPGGKKKVKQPDLEKALVNWALNQQNKGQPITTDELRNQVLVLIAGRNDQQNFISTEWLENFQRGHLFGNFTMPTSPPYQDTLLALHDIKRLLEQHPDIAEPEDFVMIGKLMEKFKLRNYEAQLAPPSCPAP